MIIVHDTFVCKPGTASKVAKAFKEILSGSPSHVAVMTDVTGQYHRVIMVSKFKNLADYENNWKKTDKSPKETKKMNELLKGILDMYVSGSREIYREW